jgi:hypothetical protein
VLAGSIERDVSQILVLRLDRIATILRVHCMSWPTRIPQACRDNSFDDTA